MGLAKHYNLGSAKRRKALELIRQAGNVSAACRALRIDRRALYLARESDPQFAADWDAAISDFVDSLEAEAVRRGRDGVPKPVFYQGERVDNGEVFDFSDSVLMFLLRTRHPEYRKAAEDDARARAPIVIEDRTEDEVTRAEQSDADDD